MSNLVNLLLFPFPAQDYVLIDGDKSPGKCIVHSGKMESGYDERKGYGLTGATLIPTGDPLGSFTLEFQIFDETDWVLWEVYYSKHFDISLKFVPGSLRPRALGISHPILEQLGITECVVVERESVEKDEYGLWTQLIHMKQYRKPKPALQAPIASIPAKAPAQPTAADAAEAEALKLADEVSNFH